MSHHRGVDVSEGWITRRFERNEKAIRSLATAKRLQAAAVGWVTVPAGGILEAIGGVIRTVGTLRRTQLRDGALEGEFDDADGNTLHTMSLGMEGAGSTVFRSSGPMRLEPAGSDLSVVVGTTASAANAVIDATTGAVTRSTSSLRYKCEVTDATIDTAAVLALTPRSFCRLDEADRLGMDAPKYVGFIAEEAAALGLDAWVTSDAEGPESFSYSTWAVALHAVTRDLHAQVQSLTTTVADLESRLAALETPPVL